MAFKMSDSYFFKDRAHFYEKSAATPHGVSPDLWTSPRIISEKNTK